MESERATARHTEKQTETDKGSWATGRQRRSDKRQTETVRQTHRYRCFIVSHCLVCCFVVVVVAFLFVVSHIYFVLLYVSVFCFCFLFFVFCFLNTCLYCHQTIYTFLPVLKEQVQGYG